MAIRISLIEDNPELREGLTALLARELEFNFVGAYASAEEAMPGIAANPSDVALLDIHLPGMNGIECTARLKATLPNLRIVILTLYEHSDLIFEAIRAGADGYLLKGTPWPELAQAIRQVHVGGAPMS